VGSVGCCDPAKPWQFLGDTVSKTLDVGLLRRPRRATQTQNYHNHRDLQDKLPTSSGKDVADASTVAYAMFVRTFGLSIFVIDPMSGQVMAKHQVEGPARDYYGLFAGESTRLFPFDPKGRRFVFVDLNRTGSEMSLWLYTIDATSGASTSKRVKGCVNANGASTYPVGIAWDSLQNTLLAASQTPSTASFCSINVDSGVGTHLGDTTRGDDEATSVSYYAAYVSLVHNHTVYRVGHQQVKTGTGSGVGLTAPGSLTQWDPLSDHTTLPASSVLHEDGFFVSLVPKSLDGSLDIVKWKRGSGSTQQLLAELHTHHPSMLNGEGILGYVGDALHGDAHATMTVQRNKSIVPYMGDKWSISFLDLKTRNLTQSIINPQPSFRGAETSPLSGFGIATNSNPNSDTNTGNLDV